MIKTVYQTTDGSIYDLREDAERHESLCVLPDKGYDNGIRVWSVTTEGDCEGRTISKLGVYMGRLTDIACHLAPKVMYSLHFTAHRPAAGFVSSKIRVLKVGQYLPPKHGIDVTLDIDSGTWDLRGQMRVDAYENAFEHGPEIKFVESNYYASVKIVRTDASAEEA